MPVWVSRRKRSPTSRPCASANDWSTIAWSSREIAQRPVRACRPASRASAPSARRRVERRDPRLAAARRSTFAWRERIDDTVCTPGTLRAAAAAAGGDRREAVGVLDHQLALEVSSTAAATELLIPAAKTVTKVTRARPIISAAAVTAVRAGVALRVLAREAAGQAPQPLQRPAGDGGQRPHQARAEERDAEQRPRPRRRPSARRGLPASPMSPNRPTSTIASPTTPSSTASTA